jgi:hypothetical protein
MSPLQDEQFAGSGTPPADVAVTEYNLRDSSGTKVL